MKSMKMSFNKSLVDRLKKEFGVKRDQDIAEKFNVTPLLFSSWKRSKGKLLGEIVKYGIEHDLDLNRVLLGRNNEDKMPFTSILMAEDLFEYYMNPKEKVAKLSQRPSPISRYNEIGFQVISQNMEPTISVSSIVFGKETTLDKMIFGGVYVVHVDQKGVFVSRYHESTEDTCIFINDNDSFGKFSFAKDKIISVFTMNKVLSDL